MSLSSLIVQREVATMRQVEEALARQVLYGGDLVTNLLEVAQVDEGVLVELLAESMRMLPAPFGRLPEPSARVKALLPREVAIGRAVAPFDLQADGKLVVAVAEPLSREIEDQVRLELGVGLEQRAAPAVRVQQALAQTYGAPLERRMVRLIARLSGEPTQAGSTPPPVVAPVAMEPARASSTTLDSRAPPRSSAWPTATVVGRLAPRAPGHRTTSTNFPAQRAPTGASPATTAAAAPAAELERASVRVGLLQRETASGPRAGRRRRGPITVEKANEEAEKAEDRNALLDLFFDFSQQFFDYSALFLVHGDIAEGRDAFGGGATRERVLGIGVPLDLPSMLSTAREQRMPVVAKASPDGLDAVLLADLHRHPDAELAVVPLVVRTRAVAIFIGDCGEPGVERSSVQQVVAFAAAVGKALERIIVRRKLSGFIAGVGEDRASRVAASSVPSKARPAVSRSDAPTRASDPPAGPTRSPSSPPVPFVSKIPKRVTTRPPSSLSAPLPPPAANVAAVRPISGPPIPREDTDGAALGAEEPSAEPRDSSATAPHLEVLEVEADAIDPNSPPDELGWFGAEGPVTDPPPSAAISVPAHKPPAPWPPVVELPSVIVDADVDRGLEAMVDRLASGEIDEVAEGELLREGARAMRALMSRFPGPIGFARSRIATALHPPRASECGPILRLVARERRVALPFVLERLGSDDAEVRGWATHLVCELPYVEAIGPLLPRLRDADASIRVSASHALAAIARTSLAPVRKALQGLAHEESPEDRTAAIVAMAKLREGSFVPEMVHSLADDDDGVVAAAHEALVQLTRQDLGTDARRWLHWWGGNGGRHRIEWLIDALTHEVAEIRKAAGEELRSLTKEYLGYAADLPPRDRDRAQQRYRDWWEIEGRGRFRQS